MSPAAIFDILFLALLLVFFEVRSILRRRNAHRGSVLPSPAVRLISVGVILLPILLLINSDVSTLEAEVFYGMVTIPLMTFLRNATEREAFLFSDTEITYIPPFFGKPLSLPVSSVSSFSVGPSGELLLTLPQGTLPTGETVIGPENGICISLDREHIVACMEGYAIPEAPYDTTLSLRREERHPATASGTRSAFQKRELALYLRTGGLLAVHLSISSGVALWIKAIGQDIFPLPSVLLIVTGLFLFLLCFFLAERLLNERA